MKEENMIIKVKVKTTDNIIGLKEGNVMKPGIDPSMPLEEKQRLLVLGREVDIKRCFR